MCFLLPQKVTKMSGKVAVLENGNKAFCDPKAGIIKKGDRVMVYGNLILNKIHERSK